MIAASAAAVTELRSWGLFWETPKGLDNLFVNCKLAYPMASEEYPYEKDPNGSAEVAGAPGGVTLLDCIRDGEIEAPGPLPYHDCGLRGAKDRVDAQAFGEMAEDSRVQPKLHCGVRPSRLSTVNKKWKVSKSRR